MAATPYLGTGEEVKGGPQTYPEWLRRVYGLRRLISPAMP